MTTRFRVRPMLLAAVLMCSVAACGGKDDNSSDLPTGTPESTTSATSTPSPTPTPSASTPTSEPTQFVTKSGQLTLVFNQPAVVSEKARPALKTYRVFQQTFRDILATDKLNPAISTVAGPNVVAYVQRVLANQTKDGDRLGGTLTVTAKIQQVGQAAVLIGGCFDQSKSYGIRSNGTTYVDDTVKKYPRLQIAAIASPSGAGWQVSDYRLEDNPC